MNHTCTGQLYTFFFVFFNHVINVCIHIFMLCVFKNQPNMPSIAPKLLMRDSSQFFPDSCHNLNNSCKILTK
jgi:hypothetical protein